MPMHSDGALYRASLLSINTQGGMEPPFEVTQAATANHAASASSTHHGTGFARP